MWVKLIIFMTEPNFKKLVLILLYKYRKELQCSIDQKTGKVSITLINGYYTAFAESKLPLVGVKTTTSWGQYHPGQWLNQHCLLSQNNRLCGWYYQTVVKISIFTTWL